MNLDLVKKYFQPETILDIGANVGQFYKEAKQTFPHSKFLLIEGNQYCEENLKNLGVDYKIALLSDCQKQVEFFLRKNELKCTGNSIYKESTDFFKEDQILVVNEQTEMLDILLNKQQFDLIKIDVQGSELDIIKGGSYTIKRSKGMILEISLIEYNQNSPSKDVVIKFLNDLNFKQVEILGKIRHPLTHEIIQEDVLFLNES